MDRSYDSIPRQGEHLGGNLDEEPSTSVRAQEAAKPSAQDSTAGGIIQCSYNEAKGHYRIRRWPDESAITSSEGYKEIRRSPEGEPVGELFDDFPEKPHFVVFENLESGEVYFDRESELSDNWTGDGRFDQVTVFDDEEAAAAYVDSRRQRT